MKKWRRVALLFILACILGIGSPVNSVRADELGGTIEHKLPDTEKTDPRFPEVEKKPQPKAKDFFNGLQLINEDGLRRGAEVTSPLVRVVGFGISIAIYFIFLVSIAMIVPDILYIQFPFMRRLLGGVDGAAADGANSPMGYANQGYSGMYNSGMGGNQSIDPRKNRLGGIVSDDAKRIVKDPSIERKFSHYIVSRALNFLALGACVVILVNSMWLGYGFWIGEMINNFVKAVFSWFGA